MHTLVELYVWTIDMWCYVDKDVHQRSSDANNNKMLLVLDHHQTNMFGMSTTATSLSSSASITQVSMTASADTVGELASSLLT